MTRGLQKGHSFASAAVLAALLFAPAAVSRAADVDVIPSGAGGYRYKTYSLEGYPADWASPTLNDSTAAGFQDGSMPFGTGLNAGPVICTETQSLVQTFWATPSVLLARRAFELPLGATNVKVVLGVDNDAKVAVNGNVLTPPTTLPPDGSIEDGWAKHENCPSPDDWTFEVPSQYLNAGTNLLAVLARERHVESWLDVRVTRDATPPLDCGAATASLTELWPPNHGFVPINVVVPTISGSPVLTTITSVTQDEPLNSVGDGNTLPDAMLINNGIGGTLMLRAERAGNGGGNPGNGRVYTINFSASNLDGSNSCTGTVTLCVPHDQSGRPCVDDAPPSYNSIP